MFASHFCRKSYVCKSFLQEKLCLHVIFARKNLCKCILQENVCMQVIFAGKTLCVTDFRSESSACKVFWQEKLCMQVTLREKLCLQVIFIICQMTRHMATRANFMPITTTPLPRKGYLLHQTGIRDICCCLCMDDVVYASENHFASPFVSISRQ